MWYSVTRHANAHLASRHRANGGRQLLRGCKEIANRLADALRLRSRDQFDGFHSLPFAAFLTPSIMTTLV
jgi:hypothetical protein